ncbi:Dps family protein [Cellulomonas endophytica]|uniref:Dps family protein n=1 Tax=Cellulomonas endophytica TaxID=2494735 RepID=UPI001011A037|nr:DNA starvation/stationary phase protection protein [Cellulomonas endophytica]
MARTSLPSYTIPTISPEDGAQVADVLQGRLHALNDLQLTLKHVHWNVVGPHFIAVHEMLDPQVKAVRKMADETAERIATLGASPKGTPGSIVAERSWDDYSLGRDGAIAHLGALDLVYTGVITDHRKAMKATEEVDDVTNDMIIGQLRELELFHWFVRAHLENAGGQLATGDASSEVEASADATAITGDRER